MSGYNKCSKIKKKKGVSDAKWPNVFTKILRSIFADADKAIIADDAQ